MGDGAAALGDGSTTTAAVAVSLGLGSGAAVKGFAGFSAQQTKQINSSSISSSPKGGNSSPTPNSAILYFSYSPKAGCCLHFSIFLLTSSSSILLTRVRTQSSNLINASLSCNPASVGASVAEGGGVGGGAFFKGGTLVEGTGGGSTGGSKGSTLVDGRGGRCLKAAAFWLNVGFTTTSALVAGGVAGVIALGCGRLV